MLMGGRLGGDMNEAFCFISTLCYSSAYKLFPKIVGDVIMNLQFMTLVHVSNMTLEVMCFQLVMLFPDRVAPAMWS